MIPFIPRFEGELELAAVPDDFVDRIKRRIENGLLVKGERRRANYEVLSASRDEITFHADSVWTAINVGLNQVTIERYGPKRIAYRVAYWTWTCYSVLLGAVIGLAVLGAYLLVDIELGSEGWELLPESPYRWAIPLGMLLFWCGAWPWVLTAMHKKHAARCLERILREELEDP